MSKFFVKREVIPNSILEDLKYDLQFKKEFQAETTRGVDLVARSAIAKRVNPKLFFDYCNIIEKFCSEIDPKHIASTLIVKEIEYLQYGIGGHFVKHDDVVPMKNPRRFSTVTMLSKTDDMEGGDLLLFDKNDNIYNVSLNVGETVVFYSSILHQVTPITCGGREVLVSWVYDRI